MARIEMSPEGRLLCLCARTRLNTEQEEEIRGIIGDSINWEELFALGSRNRMLPFLYRNLKNIQDLDIPDEVSDSLRNSYKRNASRNLFRLTAVIRIVKEFEETQIPVIVFKGPVSSSLLYKDLGLRVFTDIDMIVQADRFIDTNDVLNDIGLSSEYTLTNRQISALRKYRNELSFSSIDGSIHVDLHWKLLVEHLRILPT